MARVIIFGASGFIGSSLLNYLLKKGFSVEGYSSTSCNLLDLARVKEVMQNYESDEEPLKIIFGAVIPRQQEDSLETMILNIKMMHHALSAIPQGKLCQFIFLSSSDVYGLPVASLPLTEETETIPNTYYGLAKVACEKMLLSSLFPSVKPVTIFRLPGIYGPGDQAKSVVGGFIKKIQRQENIILTNEGKTRRDYVYIQDLCTLTEHLLLNPYHGIINVATGIAHTMEEIAKSVAEEMGERVNLQCQPGSGVRSHDLVFNTQKIKDLCPHFQFTLLPRGIRWYRESAISST